MMRWCLAAMVLLCACDSPTPKAVNSAARADSEGGFVSRSKNEPRSTVNLVSSDEASAVSGAVAEFYTGRWQEWNVGDFVAFEPAWTTGQFDSLGFDKALSFWTTKFGNDGNGTDEEILKRIAETLNTAGSPASTVGTVEKGISDMNFDPRVMLVPTSFFNDTEPWVPGSVPTKNRAGVDGSIRARGAVAYPLFSGNGQFGFVQICHVKSGHEYGQLHFFLEKFGDKWRALAVGRVAE